MPHERQEAFQRNARLEELLAELRSILEPAERAYLKDCTTPTHSVVYVIGAPRSGTTVMMQWLAGSGLVAYPSNLLSRFYASPYLGARIQQLLTDPAYSHRNELADAVSGSSSFQSELGKTQGILEPNEFYYFWRRFIPSDHEYLPSEKEAEIDGEGFRRGLAAIQRAFPKPFAMKGIALLYNLKILYTIYPNCLFLFIQRHPLYNGQSLLESRLKFYGTKHTWYSAKPPEYKQLRDRDPYTQIAGQVYFTNRSISEQLSQIDARHVLEVSYEEFCAAPARTFQAITAKLCGLGYAADVPYTGPESFTIMNKIRLPADEFQQLRDAYREFSGEEVAS